MSDKLAFLCKNCGFGDKTLDEFCDEQLTKNNNIVVVICPNCGYDPKMKFEVTTEGKQ